MSLAPDRACATRLRLLYHATMHFSPFVLLWACAFVLAAPSALADGSDEGPRKKLPTHISSGAGVFLPWDGDQGFNVSALLHKGLGSDRFWVGGELEYRRYEAELKRGYQPEYNTFALRFSFQYHPFPKSVVSPYAGIGVGIAASYVDDTHSGGQKVREEFGAGPTLVAVAGGDLAIPALDPLAFFAEARIGNTTDLWFRRGGNFQMDQIDGFTGMAGLRLGY